MTFDPHPSEVVRPGSHPPVLTPVRPQGRAGRGARRRRVCVLPFTTEFSRLPRRRVRARACWSSSCTPRAVVVGENFRFGHKAAGDLEMLRTLGTQVRVLDRGVGLLRDDDVTLSSTFVRSSIDAGDVGRGGRGARPAAPDRRHRGARRRAAAGSSASRPPTCAPTGTSRSRPTGSTPAGPCCTASGCRRPSRSAPTRRSRASSARSRRTSSTSTRTSTACELGVEFVGRLRGMVKFDSVEALVEQMGRDVEQARDLLR